MTPIKTRYRPDIQGLRALAILPVVLYHADHRLVPGGFAGVDIFFVISGYLITGIVVGEINEGRYSLISFYRRRILRLFPALTVMLAATFLVGLLLLSPEGLRLLGSSIVATVGFASNLEFLRRSSYFGPNASFDPLLHTWSLAVEEQFYIFFPPLLAALMAVRRALVVPILTAAAAMSLVLCVWLLSTGRPSAAFYLAPARAYELLIGALLACGALPAIRSPRLRNAASLAGLSLIAGSMIVLDRSTVFPGLAALPPCLGAALVIHAGRATETVGGRLISGAPLVLVGSLSYSLYLWHWPMLVYARHWQLGELSAGVAAATVVASFACAYLSWRFIEQPVLASSLSTGTVFRFGAAAMSAGVAAGAALFLTKGLPARFSPEAATLFASKEDFSKRGRKCHNDTGRVVRYEELCSFGAPGATPDAIVWADSHGVELAEALGEKMARHGRSLLVSTTSACPPAPGFETKRVPRCAALNAVMFDRIRGDPRIKVVLMAANYSGYANSVEVAEKLGRAAEELERSGKRVIVMEQLPLFSYDVPTALGLIEKRGLDLGSLKVPKEDYDRDTAATVELLRALRDRTGVQLLDPSAALCAEAECRSFERAAGVLYHNRDHLSLSGARFVVNALRIDEVVQGP